LTRAASRSFAKSTLRPAACSSRLARQRRPLACISPRHEPPQNEQHYRDLTLRVYGGDSTTRIMQEIVLGIGGIRLLRALGIKPSVFHMNEGHAAFLALELVRENQGAGMEFHAALAAARKQCHFTTHTPVEAGHDRFSPDLMHYALNRFERRSNARTRSSWRWAAAIPLTKQSHFA
jgi:starch phosphorylase